jgi:hypothetical protein
MQMEKAEADRKRQQVAAYRTHRLVQGSQKKVGSSFQAQEAVPSE